MKGAEMIAPLSGLKIVDMTSVIMGPYATQILADYGADVIKVESHSGDTTRQIPPMRNSSMGSTFLHLNRNKRSIALDLRKKEALLAFLRLTDTADVFITNVRPSGLARLGITFEALSKSNSRLIWISLVGFGSSGPYAGRPAYDDLIQSLTAVPSMLVSAGSETPHFVPVSFNDRAVGLHAAIALLAAINHRHATGRGQFIEIPMFETMVQFSIGDHMGGNMFDPPLGPPGYQRTLSKHRRPSATKDGYITTVIYTDQHWRNFFEIIGDPERFDNDPRVGSLLTRTEHADMLYNEIAEAMRLKTTSEWLDLLSRADIPAAPLHTLDSVFTDPHLVESEFFQFVDHPTEGLVRQMSLPSKWTNWEPGAIRPAPAIGQHGMQILSEVGLSEQEIEAALLPSSK